MLLINNSSIGARSHQRLRYWGSSRRRDVKVISISRRVSAKAGGVSIRSLHSSASVRGPLGSSGVKVLTGLLASWGAVAGRRFKLRFKRGPQSVPFVAWCRWAFCAAFILFSISLRPGGSSLKPSFCPSPRTSNAAFPHALMCASGEGVRVSSGRKSRVRVPGED